MDPSKKPKPQHQPAEDSAKTAPRAASGDFFQSSRTAPLRPQSVTRRLDSNLLNPHEALDAMATEVSNGRTLLSKLHPRLTVLQRAVEVLEAPDQASVILRGVGAGELGFTRQVVQILQEDPRVLRQVRVALNQWTQAQKGVASAEAVLSQAAAFPEAHRAAFVAEHCHVEKLRGQLYPLINLHVVFRETPILSQLVPAPKPGYREKTPAPKPLDAASAVRTSTAPGQVQTSIEDEVKAVDAAISQVVGSIKQATGTLKKKLKGFFGGVPTENE